MDDTTETKPIFENLPTGKFHVSFSEVKLWKDCSFRHYLAHVKKVNLSKPSPVLDYGTAVHAACEDYLRTREMKPQVCFDSLDAAWKLHENDEGFTADALQAAKIETALILAEIPAFLEKEFPGWITIDAEHQLYEPVENYPHAFKGFIDGVIKTTGKRGEDLYWLLDWKTTARGWFRDKRSDPMVTSQLGLYKNYWHQKNSSIPFKNVRCGFVLLKKSAKPGEHCELFAVSLGEVPIKRSLKVVGNMISSIKKGMKLKNRSSCMYCEFKGTEWCT